jgi:hypothetical protein
MYICRNFWFDHLFLENQSKINIKNPEGVTQEQRQWARMGWALLA